MYSTIMMDMGALTVATLIIFPVGPAHCEYKYQHRRFIEETSLPNIFHATAYINGLFLFIKF